jgi:hypothetical protein
LRKQFSLIYMTVKSETTCLHLLRFLMKEELKDTKGVIRFRILKMNRQHNDQKKKDNIPKRRIFMPLFLFCAYDSSVLQNFKIFTHLLPNVSYKDPRLMEVTYYCISFNDRVRRVPYSNLELFLKFLNLPSCMPCGLLVSI